MLHDSFRFWLVRCGGEFVILDSFCDGGLNYGLKVMRSVRGIPASLMKSTVYNIKYGTVLNLPAHEKYWTIPTRATILRQATSIPRAIAGSMKRLVPSIAFTHVAREHGIIDICFSSSGKIYTLQNIEISQAFSQNYGSKRAATTRNPIICKQEWKPSITHLMCFSNLQKVEILTMKSIFHARNGRNDDANHSFGQAVQMVMFQAKV
jgi:hypothetical protein